FFSAVEDHQFPAYAVTISSRSHQTRICLCLLLPPWTCHAIRHARLPSCVTPVTTLTYYQFGSRAQPPPRWSKTTQWAPRAFSITGIGMGGPSPVREYQPVIHRLRLSASP